MPAPLPRILTSVVAVLLTVLIAGCAGRPVAVRPATIAPATVASATATVTPAPPSPTPSPRPRTATPSPTPSPAPGDAAALLQQAQSKHQAITSARGTMEIAVALASIGVSQPPTTTIDFEFADPDVHIKLSRPELLAGMGVEAIVKGDTSYLKVGEQWTALPAGSLTGQRPTGDPMGVEELQSYLDGAAGLKVTGQRTVKGATCDIVSFTLAPEKLRALSVLQGQAAARRVLDEDVVIEAFQGEAAIGAQDRLIRQVVFQISGHDRQIPEQKFNLRFVVTLWDLNVSDIVIQAPSAAELAAGATRIVPTATPTALPTPLQAYRSPLKPVVDGVIAPADGWDKAQAVSGPYADGQLEIKALHDGEDLYLLLVWDEKTDTRGEGLNIYFEDGGTQPQRQLDGRNDDARYVGVGGLPDGYRDAAWVSGGWSVGEATDGVMAGRYHAGKMVVEWRGPLNDGSATDISVTGDETLGFAVVNWAGGVAGQRGAWPLGADTYDAGTWGRLVVHFTGTAP